MKTSILILLIAASLGNAWASEEEGLFIIDQEVAPRQEFKEGEVIMRWEAERLILTRAVFRYDTEDKTRYWLELDFTKWADPGDFYLFKIDGQDYQGFAVRGEGTNERGGRWALGFTDANAGREMLAKVAAAYELDPKHTLDQTKGEQRGPEQPTTPHESDSEGSHNPF